MTDQDRSDDDTRRIMASRLRIARETLGLTQEDTAEALNIPRSSVSAFESGHRNVTGLEIRRLSRLYRTPVSWLLGDDYPPDDPALIQATTHLSARDRECVLRFARFLVAQPRAGD